MTKLSNAKIIVANKVGQCVSGLLKPLGWKIDLKSRLGSFNNTMKNPGKAGIEKHLFQLVVWFQSYPNSLVYISITTVNIQFYQCYALMKENLKSLKLTKLKLKMKNKYSEHILED